MPWRGPEPGFPYPTLGVQVAEWIEENCVVPDGVHQGEPYTLTQEMRVFLKRFYRIEPHVEGYWDHPSRAFKYRGFQLRRPQKWGKSPFGGAIDLAETFGPVRFDGWNADGRPIGRPQPTPWVQIVATAEDQTDNTWLAVYEMATRGPIADLPGVDIGVMGIILPSGGRLEPRSSRGTSRQGGRLTYGHFDESHLMVESTGGVLLATTMKRNLAGMGGRWGETTNAFDPSENSVAQRTSESNAEDVLIDNREAPRRPDLDDVADSRELLGFVYGDSHWVDLDRVLADSRDPAVCPTEQDALRYFFNRCEVGVTDAVDSPRWDAAAHPEEQLEKGTAIVLGFDGSKTTDVTSLVASRISDGRWFHLKSWDPALYERHQIPKKDVDDVIVAAFAAYDVKYLVGDPPYWEEYFDIWRGRWGDAGNAGKSGRVIDFSTNNDRLMDDAITRFLSLQAGGTFTHNGDPTLTAHAKNAALARGQRKRPRPDDPPSILQHYLRVVKKREHGHPIDAFIAGILAEVARGLAIENGALTPPQEPMVAW